MTRTRNHWPEAVRIWVALAWRSLLLIFILRVVLGVTVHIVAWGFSLSAGAMTNTAAATGLLIWLIIPVLVLRGMLAKGFGRYRLAVRRRPIHARLGPAGSESSGPLPHDAGDIPLEVI